MKLGRNGSFVCRCILWRPGFECLELLLKNGAQFDDETSRLPQDLFDFLFFLRIRRFFKPPELIALSQHVEKSDEVMS